MNYEELFEELFDDLFWSGFSKQLKQNDPDRYTWELNEFLSWYE